jgi:hypothetical protein
MPKEVKRTIDPEVYGVDGYGHVPAYNIPYVATGHMMYYPARELHESLCGQRAPSLHGRKVEKPNKPWLEPWKVCKRCQKVAADQGLVEWTMPSLKPSQCPVFSKRHGAPAKHIMNPYRTRCSRCPKQDGYRLNERCARKHPTYARCSGCGLEDRDRHFCDYVVGRTMGISTQFGYCDRKAVAEVEMNWRLGYEDKKKAWRWVCFQHHPDAFAKRKAEFQSRMQADNDRWTALDKQHDDEREAMRIVVDMARWIAANHELVEEDEWLGKIALRMAENSLIQARLSGKVEVDA